MIFGLVALSSALTSSVAIEAIKGGVGLGISIYSCSKGMRSRSKK